MRGGVTILMVVKLILSISILLSSVQVMNVENPIVCELCPGTLCDEV